MMGHGFEFRRLSIIDCKAGFFFLARFQLVSNREKKDKRLSVDRLDYVDISIPVFRRIILATGRPTGPTKGFRGLERIEMIWNNEDYNLEGGPWNLGLGISSESLGVWLNLVVLLRLSNRPIFHQSSIKMMQHLANAGVKLFFFRSTSLPLCHFRLGFPSHTRSRSKTGLAQGWL